MELEQIEKEIERNKKLIELNKLKAQQETQLAQISPPDKNVKSEDDIKKTDLLKLDSKTLLRLLAKDVYSLHRKLKNLMIINVAGLVITMLIYVFNSIVGSGVAVILCAVNGWFMIQSENESQRLKKEYKF